ncbi:MAG: hypothetical protein ACI8V2_000863 [Candidatus Latescibacterota bacterium]|jgi:hypothetical protein
MRISSSNIQFASHHFEVQKYSRKETITERIRQIAEDTPSRTTTRAAKDTDRPTMMSERVLNPNLVGVPDRFEGMATMMQRATQTIEGRRNSVISNAEPTEGIDAQSFEVSAEDKAKVEMIIAAVERMSGKKIKLVEPDKALKEAYQTPTLDNLPVVAQQNADIKANAEAELQAAAEAPPPIRIREVRYQFEESYYEAESTSFEAQGVVKTADGKEISIDVSLSMSREFSRKMSLDVTLEETVKDPLVINFEGTAAELTDRKFAFDIDMDGSADQINFVKPGSGFLALDKNGDGTINDGNELFGARTGNGFSELAAYDDDGNGFIDEGDSVYEGLRIFSKDANGNDQLVALGQRGVGAIYLGHTDTPFQMKDENNQLQGIVRKSGVFLNENGSVGTVQQIDLVA